MGAFCKCIPVLIGVFFSFSVFGQNQSGELKKVKTTESGVLIYESGGVEGFNKEQQKTNDQKNVKVAKPVSQWNLEECTNALTDIDHKIEHLREINAPKEEIEKYLVARKEVFDRKQFLLNQTTTK